MYLGWDTKKKDIRWNIFLPKNSKHKIELLTDFRNWSRDICGKPQLGNIFYRQEQILAHGFTQIINWLKIICFILSSILIASIMNLL
tara:strand:+ start:585 stop:845 length:261 start_codon:yes stop_codon:yes gene_type:complete